MKWKVNHLFREAALHCCCIWIHQPNEFLCSWAINQHHFDGHPNCCLQALVMGMTLYMLFHRIQVSHRILQIKSPTEALHVAMEQRTKEQTCECKTPQITQGRIATYTY